MINSLIIGAGQLGSRHLQGLLKFEKEQLIYVLDPSENSLNISKERAQEVENKHNLIFINDWDKLPTEFDLVIVATGANVRSKVVSKLLTDFKVKNLILEKILLSFSYAPIGMKEEDFADLKINWLIKNKRSDLIESFLKQSDYHQVAIAQPSLLLGNRGEFRLGESLFSVVTPLMPKAVRSVQGADVAGALIRAANSDSTGVEILVNKNLHGQSF